MKRALWTVFLTLVLVVGLTVGFTSQAFAAFGHFPHRLTAGAVYTMTNDAAGNQIVVYDRAADGTLTMMDSVPTGGTGSGGDFDALVSQGSLILSNNGAWLLAVNAGSNDITVFRVKPDGLEATDQESSGGNMPVSLTMSFGRVYVLNAGGIPNITGFVLGFNGKLNPIPNSTRELGSGAYSQIGFNNLGGKLVVTDRADNELLVYNMNWFGVPSANPVVTTSSGQTPFGFVFDNLGRMLVVEVNGGNGAVSSYRVKFDGNLDVITGSEASGQAAACWIVRDNLGRVYTTNPASSSISYYHENFKGEVSLVDATAATGIGGLDAGISNNGQFLYALDPNSGGVDMYRINFNGSLTSLGLAPGGLNVYAQGLAVK